MLWASILWVGLHIVVPSCLCGVCSEKFLSASNGLKPIRFYVIRFGTYHVLECRLPAKAADVIRGNSKLMQQSRTL